MTKQTNESRQTLVKKLVSETARIHWTELQRFFAAGKAVCVDKSQDLIQVAASMVEDDQPAIQSLMRSGQMGLVSDQQARQWELKDAMLWAVVVAPWVLVQEPGVKKKPLQLFITSGKNEPCLRQIQIT